MYMSLYRSGFSSQIQLFVDYRKASGRWDDRGYGYSLKQFDHFCADTFPPNSPLNQEMVDRWCAKRDTELNSTCNRRTLPIRTFIQYLQDRNLSDVSAPKILRKEPCTHIPYAFSYGEIERFFAECDSIIPRNNGIAAAIRKLTCPVFFRLLYSSGIRTTEARLLRKRDVDLEHGILNIQKSKGCDQHYVALHQTMTDLLARYDRAIEELIPGRTYFFENAKGGHLEPSWVACNFRLLWDKANGSSRRAVAYDFRHNYAIQNINSWTDDSFEFSDKLHYLARSMGHRKTASTLYYYSIVPRLADTIKSQTETGFNEIVPEVCYEEE